MMAKTTALVMVTGIICVTTLGITCAALGINSVLLSSTFTILGAALGGAVTIALTKLGKGKGL